MPASAWDICPSRSLTIVPGYAFTFYIIMNVTLQVEELVRNRPLNSRGAPIASTGLGLLDRFGDRMESFADSMERSVSRMAVKLGDSKLAQVREGAWRC